MRLAIAAQAPALRAGLRLLLGAAPGIEVAAEAATLAELPAPGEVDVLVLAAGAAWRDELEDWLAPGGSTAVLLLVGEEGTALRWLAELGDRAWGALPLESSSEELLAAVHALGQGLVAGSPRLLQPLLTSSLAEGPALDEPPGGALTEREAEVLQLLAQGLANKQIAVQLGISEHTVKFHVSAIYTKLGASSRTEAVRIGVRLGWVTL
jgi:DNA-binding NarL/FixJ family response regulator